MLFADDIPAWFLLLFVVSIGAAAEVADMDRLVTGADKPGDPMTGLGTPVDVALGAAIGALFMLEVATGALAVVSFGVSSPLYIPAAICACVWA